MLLSKRLLSGAGLFLLSFILILLWTGFNPEGFLVDDNRTQWFPIIEDAYETLFRTGTMPVYNFFQFKGVSIADPGYYSIMNPIMLLSYILSHYTPLPFSTITIYIALLFSFGNIAFYRLCREFQCSAVCSIFLMATYCGMASFMAFSHWYYVFNNYLIIPLLFLVFLRTKGKKTEWFACGLLLAFEILLGNVQYACYHYIIYGLICLMYAIMEHKKHIRIFLSNILCAGLLSAPFLFMAAKAGGNFQNNEFHAEKESLNEIVMGAFIPMGIRGLWGTPLQALWSTVHERRDATWLYNGGFAIFWLIMLIYGIHFLRKKVSSQNIKYLDKNTKFSEVAYCFRTHITSIYRNKIVQNDGRHILIIGIVFCILFFVSLLHDGIVALVMGKLPVIKNFRYLFKCQFVIQPLVGILTAAVLPRIQHRKIMRAVVPGLCIFACVGLINNFFVTQTTHQLFTEPESLSLAEENDYYESEIKPDMPDLNMYRQATVLILADIKANTFRYYNGLLRNYPTTSHTYSLVGYELSAPQAHMEQYDSVYNIKSLTANMIGCTIPKKIEKPDRSDNLKQQLLDNSIKYILLETNPGKRSFSLDLRNGWESYLPSDEELVLEQKELAIDHTNMIVESLEKSGIAVADVRPLDAHYTLIEIADPTGLCTDDYGQALPLSNNRMDQISFDANGSENYTLSFTYEENLSAYNIDDSGNKKSLQVTKAENGNTIIHTQHENSGKIYLVYKDTIYTVAFFLEAIISLLFLWVLFLIGRRSPCNSKMEER